MVATVKTLYTFVGGGGPEARLLIDAKGDLFGTARFTGQFGEGSVFEIANTGTGYATTLTTIVSFNGTNGGFPHAPLIADAAGNLYGTATNGGPSVSEGTVFRIATAATATGYASVTTTLYAFNASNGNGRYPLGGLIADANGNLFGTASEVDSFTPYGTVFEIPKTQAGYGALTTLVSFNSTNGAKPSSSLIMDANGNLFGTNNAGGNSPTGQINVGTVFEIARTQTGYATLPTTLATFNGTNGASPMGGLAADSAGNLFGTTSTGGTHNSGTVFEIPKTVSGYGTLVTLVDFNTVNGLQATDSLLIDGAGNLFGTTQNGGSKNFGEVYEIVKTGATYATAPTILVNFDGTTNSQYPIGGLSADANGNLFGTTAGLGTGTSLGTVFEITGAGFVPVVACFAAGTLIETPTGARPVETLMEGDTVSAMLGGSGRIVWAGTRRIDCARHDRPETIWPIRIAAHAFGDLTPSRDLLVSPDHALYVDGVLIPAKYLVNGGSVRQVPVDHIAYHHIELERHDIVMANGMMAESYLNAGDRGKFTGETVAAPHPAWVARTWEMAGCAPLIVSGEKLEQVRARLAPRGQRHAA